MNFKRELAQLAAAGIDPAYLLGGVGIIVIGVIFYFRRAIFRAVSFVFSVVFALFLLSATIGGAMWFYTHFGLMHASGFVAAVALFIYLAGRSGRGTRNGWNSHDDWEQEDQDRRSREHDLREAERIHREHQESIRRNPW